VILITHHMEEAAKAGRVIVRSEGRVIMDGTPREIFSRADELLAAGLSVPQPVELLRRLRAAGAEIESDALTPEECAAAIAGYIKKIMA
jgi:energy-coupling factor transport system ATP-binding protein